MWRKSVYNKSYSVNEIGEVRNDETGYIMTPIKTPCGYYKANIGGKQVDIQLIVARAFPEICGEWYKGCQINHLDEDKANNSASNLRIVSPSQNCLWGTRSERKTESGSGLKRKVYQYDGEELVGIWESQSLASRFLGINQTNISRCIKGVYKSAGGYRWTYDAA